MNALTREAFVGALFALRERYWDRHPFNIRLQGGGCTPDEVRTWVANRWYYQSLLSQKNAAIIANCPLPHVRAKWVQRLAFQDEGGLDDWLVLVKAVGLDHALEPLPGVRFAVDAYVRFCKDNTWVIGAAAALTELFAPDHMAARVVAWRQHYPWLDEQGYAYFEHRIPVVRADSQYTLQLVADHCHTRSDQEAAIAALAFKCDVLWAMADAIEHAGCRR
ncbi:pyrroloquinoline-quinone synthase PqqC [Micromonospora sp. H33]|uniref:pyrroloquinoline-quinone synthase PqqC n=1 Tax=Micromonospora sp. H33 TaxID=3452215 RepID=UPI003F8C6261